MIIIHTKKTEKYSPAMCWNHHQIGGRTTLSSITREQLSLIVSVILTLLKENPMVSQKRWRGTRLNHQKIRRVDQRQKGCLAPDRRTRAPEKVLSCTRKIFSCTRKKDFLAPREEMEGKRGGKNWRSWRNTNHSPKPWLRCKNMRKPDLKDCHTTTNKISENGSQMKNC